MSLRALISESETEYKYRIYSTAPIHDGAALGAIRIGLAGRMARDIKPGGVLPWMGTKADRFPAIAMKPTYVVDLVTGLPLSISTAVRELSFALQVAEELIQIEGEDREYEVPKDPNKPYAADRVTPGFLGKDDKQETPMKTLKDLLGDLSDGKGEEHHEEEVFPVYEGFTITQIEAEAILDTDLRRGYYVVRGLNEHGRIGISGPHKEVPFNYPLDLDRAQNVTVQVLNGERRDGDLIEFDVSLIKRPVLKEMMHSSQTLTTVRVSDTDTGKEYPVLVSVRPGMGEEEIRNAAVMQVAQKMAISPERLIAMDPNRPHAAVQPSAQAIV
jgi:hypothetical protein